MPETPFVIFAIHKDDRTISRQYIFPLSDNPIHPTDHLEQIPTANCPHFTKAELGS